MTDHTKAPRYWITVATEGDSEALRTLFAVAHHDIHRDIDHVRIESIDINTSNGTYRVHSNGFVQRTRILPECSLQASEAWTKGFTDEPHGGEPCRP